VPVIDGNVVVCVDVSGSMSYPVTGFRRGQTSVTRCVDVAALMAAAILRQNSRAMVLPFDTEVRDVNLNARDTVMTNSGKLAALCGGGTACSVAIDRIAVSRHPVDLVVLISDNQSWFDATPGHRGTATMQAWERVKKLNRQARLVCLDIAPYTTTQAHERLDILNVGGFSDAVFDIIGTFARGELSAAHWVSEINKVRLDAE
jgi:60 kDa SS-A/Ro ribonucleoprotein